jgi:hypothetical protein
LQDHARAPCMMDRSIGRNGRFNPLNGNEAGRSVRRAGRRVRTVPVFGEGATRRAPHSHPCAELTMAGTLGIAHLSADP